MNDDETFAVDQAHGYESPLAIILAVVDARQNITFEDQGGVQDIYFAFFDNFLPLVFVPFEFQRNSPRIE